MTLRNCIILFDNRPDKVFFSGETVTGVVSLTLEKNKKCQALMLKVLGVASCSWTESQIIGKKVFLGNEVYFETLNNLMAEQHVQTGASDLVAGKHTFNFTIVLPPNLPSSFEGMYGHVRYLAEVKLKRPYKIDLSSKNVFTVLSHLNLNELPSIQLPMTHELLKNFNYLLVDNGMLEMTIKIPSLGFISGESIPVICNIKNESKIKVECIKLQLVKMILYTSKYPIRKHKVEMVKVSRYLGGGVNCGEEKIFELSLLLPELPPSSFTMSSIIEVKYELKAKAVISGFHSNLKSIIPIVIGTAYTNQNANMGQSTSSHDPEVYQIYNEMLRPSNEEVLIAKGISE
ncbi:arrestin domain-containing protein 3-like [Arctopsyche grandis]|uniref:arrestin domain-containing protein 3-like n=1 Tax=Arctopsyche grandis TaxID=121162 RepID=UPI00406D8BD5